MNEINDQTGPLPPGTRCLGCRYDLGGLSRTDDCPECSLPVSGSLDWQWLGLEAQAYRRRLVLGATLVWVAGAGLWFLLLALGLIVPLMLLDGEVGRLFSSLLAWIPGGLVGAELCVGWWFLSAPSPRGRRCDGLQRVRAAPRLFALATTVLGVGGIGVLMVRALISPSGTTPALVWLAGPGGDALLGLAFTAALLGALLTHLSGVWYLSRLSTRLDSACSRYAPGSLAASLRQTGRIPVYALLAGGLAVVLYPVSILMVGFFAIVPIAWAALAFVLVPAALLFALARSVWLVARFTGRLRSLAGTPGGPALPVSSTGHATPVSLPTGAEAP